MAKDEVRKGPSVVAPTTRVTVAFPFSTVKSQEPSPELRELAVLVAQLTEKLAKLDPSAEADELLQHARALVTKLG